MKGNLPEMKNTPEKRNQPDSGRKEKWDHPRNAFGFEKFKAGNEGEEEEELLSNDGAAVAEEEEEEEMISNSLI